MKKTALILFWIGFSLVAYGQKAKVSVDEYIETWKNVAIDQMISHKIPASITLAQGILESGYGNSTLAVRANNHFGIKCHDWKGKKFYQDDDAKNECFRKYKSAAESFQDHSEFLTSRSRYADLFELKITDYKGWAKGLKKAGYATNPQYAKRLIDVVEKYKLYQYDDMSFDMIVQRENDNPFKPNSQVNSNTSANATVAVKEQRPVYVNNNRTKYVIAGKHDTFYQIAKEFGLNIKQLNRWNNFHPKKDVLAEGDKVYIMNKRKKAGKETPQIRVQGGQTLWDISQEYGIQLKSLLDKNNFDSPDVAINNGDIIKLK